MYLVLYSSGSAVLASPSFHTIQEARKYAKERMDEPDVTEAVITKDRAETEGSDPIEYYGPEGHCVL